MTVAPTYARIAEALAEQIAAGTFRPGDRLPSVRRLTETMGVSATTAARALVELEAMGRAEARPRSGFYVAAPEVALARVPAATRPSDTAEPVDVNRLIAALFKATAGASGERRLMPFGAAELDEDLLPHRELARLAAEVAREEGAALLAYGPAAGEPTLRRRIARLMGERGVVVAPDEVIVTAGETDAMGTALEAVARPGDTIAVESPSFFGILQWIETLGLKAVAIATDPRLGLDLDALERVAATTRLAAVALNPTFHNPFGFAMPAERMARLLAIAKARDLTLIEDDVYGELHRGRPAAGPLKRFDDDGRVIYCSSFSKTLAPGFRVGWCLPGRHGPALAAVRAPRNAGVGRAAQLTLARFLETRGWPRHLDRLRAVFAGQHARVRATLLDAFPPGTRVSDPAGGFVYWVDVPPPFDALAFHARALAAGISIAPGPIFSPTGAFPHAFRLSLGTRFTPGVEAAIRRLGALAGEG